MPKLACFDPASAAPHPVYGWIDSDAYPHSVLPDPAAILTVSDAEWAARMASPGGWAVQDGALVSYTPPPPPTPTTWYVPVPLLFSRLVTAGHAAAAEAAIAAQPGLMLHLMSLRQGVANDDAQAVALLAAIGADATVILALPD